MHLQQLCWQVSFPPTPFWSVPQDIFQAYMDAIISKAGKGIVGIVDDVVVHGQDVHTHNEALHRLIENLDLCFVMKSVKS